MDCRLRLRVYSVCRYTGSREEKEKKKFSFKREIYKLVWVGGC